MAKKMFAVFRPAEIWYRLDVWAESAEEAEAMTKHPVYQDANWALDDTTVVMVDGDWDVVEYEATI
jgi:hypothetical protein